MPKRFTDTDKWKKRWFRCLRNDFKVFWIYVLDQCNHAGIWEVDFELAWFYCKDVARRGMSYTRWKKEIQEVFYKQYQEIDDGKRWFIKDFIEFQYNTLSESCKPHIAVINTLNKYNIKGYTKGIQTLKEKDTDTEQVIVKVKKKESKAIQLKNIQSDLPSLAIEFPNIDITAEFEKWKDWMMATGKRYKIYRSAFKNWCRNDFVSENKTTLKDLKTDISGFYLGKCDECGETGSYSKSEIFQDSRCCKSGIQPLRRVPDNAKGVRSMYNLEGDDVLRTTKGGEQSTAYD